MLTQTVDSSAVIEKSKKLIAEDGAVDLDEIGDMLDLILDKIAENNDRIALARKNLDGPDRLLKSAEDNLMRLMDDNSTLHRAKDGLQKLCRMRSK